MNRLRIEKRVQVISALVEGVSINATCRMTGAAKHTVLNRSATWAAPNIITGTFAVSAPVAFNAMRFGHSSEQSKRTHRLKRRIKGGATFGLGQPSTRTRRCASPTSWVAALGGQPFPSIVPELTSGQAGRLAWHFCLSFYLAKATWMTSNSSLQ